MDLCTKSTAHARPTDCSTYGRRPVVSYAEFYAENYYVRRCKLYLQMCCSSGPTALPAQSSITNALVGRVWTTKGILHHTRHRMRERSIVR
jgi:hypothetical protein